MYYVRLHTICAYCIKSARSGKIRPSVSMLMFDVKHRRFQPCLSHQDLTDLFLMSVVNLGETFFRSTGRTRENAKSFCV